MHHRDEKHSCAHAEKHLVTHVVYEKTDVCLMDNLNDLLTVTVTIGNAGDSWDNDGRHLPEILQEKSYSLSGPLRRFLKRRLLSIATFHEYRRDVAVTG